MGVAACLLGLAFAVGPAPGCRSLARWRTSRVYAHVTREDEAPGAIGTNEILFDILPRCERSTPDVSCMDRLTAAFGGGRFHPEAPDDASAAAMAMRIFRDERTERVPEGESWVALLRAGRGDGVDILRLTVAWHLAYESGSCPLEVEPCAQREMRAAALIPGTCTAYARLRDGKGDTLLRDDERACVSADRGQAAAPGGSESDFTRTALAARWRTRSTLAAIRAGLENTSPRGRVLLTKYVTDAEEAARSGL